MKKFAHEKAQIIFSATKFIFHFWSSCLKEASGPWKILIQWMPALEVTKQTQQVNRSSFSFFTISHSHTWIHNGDFCSILCKKLCKIHGCHYDITSSGKIDGQMLFERVFSRFYWLILHFFRIKIDQCENHSELLLLSNTLRSHLGRWQFFGLALYSTIVCIMEKRVQKASAHQFCHWMQYYNDMHGFYAKISPLSTK